MAQPIVEVPVTLPHPALPAGEWADAYRVVTTHSFPSARVACETAFTGFPAWVHALMALRNLIVTPLRLKTGTRSKPAMPKIGFFPLLSENPDQVVVGLNDRHLDFRCVLDLAETTNGQAITISTIINRHNWLGRFYLATILPFHRLIMRVVMARLARAIT